MIDIAKNENELLIFFFLSKLFLRHLVFSLNVVASDLKGFFLLLKYAR